MAASQRIIPAIIPTSQAALIETVRDLPFAHELQIDVVDGKFVPPVSWPYEPSGDVSAVAPSLAPHTIEVDLMVEDPIAAAETWMAAGAQRLVFHIESISVSALSDFAQRHAQVSIGVSALNDTPWETLAAYLSHASYVQLMGIATIGAQGQAFDDRVLERIAAVTATAPALPISIDGSVNPDTIVRLRAAGADRLVVGSALLQAADWEQQYRHLETLARPQTAA